MRVGEGSLEKNKKIKDEKKYTNRSRLINEYFIVIGKIKALKAKTRPTFAIFDPIAFPIASDELPWNAAFKLTNNSGREVPNATTVNPITIVEIPYFSAIATPPLTIHSDPK